MCPMLEHVHVLNAFQGLSWIHNDLAENANYGIKCELHMADGEVNLSSLAELELLCVTQEALANIRKHSDASTVQVVFVTKDDGAELIIKDNGSGFDVNTVPQGYGLKIMEERVKSIGGDFFVNSVSGHGTEVKVKLAGSRKPWMILSEFKREGLLH